MAEAQKRSRIDDLFMELVGHASWRVIEVLCGAFVITAFALFYQWLKHHWDITAIILLFFVSCIMLALASRMRRRQADEPPLRVAKPSHPLEPLKMSLKEPDSSPSAGQTRFKKPNWGVPPRDAATDANGNTVRAGDLVLIPAWVKKVTHNGPTEQLEVYTAYLLPDHLINPSHQEGSRLTIIASQVEKSDEENQSRPKPFSAEDIVIFPASPAMFVNPYRSETEVQLGIFSAAPVELLYVKAQIILNSVQVTILQHNEPAAIPAFNPRSQMLAKGLTEKELQRFGNDQSAWFDIAGNAKFRGPKNQQIDVNFGFKSAAWWLPPPKG